MNHNRAGRLFGIGVGPGEGALITLKAIETLKKLRTVFVPQSAAEKDSLALEIAGAYLSADCRVTRLLFPMIKDRQALARHWEQAAKPVAAALQAGEDCGFLTLGDPMLFSTYVYLVRAVAQLVPAAEFESIPGISSAFAAASKSGQPLAEGDDSLAVITGEKIDLLESLADDFATIVIMKVGKNLPEIQSCLRRLRLDKNAVLTHRIGLAGEVIAEADGVEDVRLGYLSTIIVRTRA